MNVRMLPITATDDDIRELVVEWSETIARGGFSEALNMFPFKDDWSADLLKLTIQGYGVPELDETLTKMLKEWQVDEFKITSLLTIKNAEIFIRDAIDVSRDGLSNENSDGYLGMVHYRDIPISGYISDLTARFNIKKIGERELTLEFLDIHVM